MLFMKFDSQETRSSVSVYFPFGLLYLRLLSFGQGWYYHGFYLLTRTESIRTLRKWWAFEKFAIWTDTATRKRSTRAGLSDACPSAGLAPVLGSQTSISERCVDRSSAPPNRAGFIPACSFSFHSVLSFSFSHVSFSSWPSVLSLSAAFQRTEPVWIVTVVLKRDL